MAQAKAVTIYGIKNCDTMKKARDWLDTRKITYGFHDYRAEGLERSVLEDWARKTGWETLLNRSSTTFRALPETSKESITETKAIALMLDHLTVIKRPVLDVAGRLIVGFKPEVYEKAPF